ncbi:MAG: ABC transporter ATP-binding protein [Lachnospiraceae bacterium]|nr:ABC transporter ATP-binding protein [Lachnospiraceae bacterium]
MISCDSLVKIYMTDNRKVMALEGLDLTIEDGEMMAIIGKSGSGKSTLLHMIGGLETPTAGLLTVDGKDISGFTEKEMVEYRKKKVGFVWQKSARNLFPYMTVLQNVVTPMNFSRGKRSERRKRAMELLEAVGMDRHAGKFPAQLSGGEQQRVAIAVALANDPAILLADEPTGAVDTRTANQIFSLFHKLNRELGITIVIVTHDMALADRVDRTVLISDGKISTEKIRKESAEEMLRKAQEAGFTGEETDAGKQDTHEEYSVLDKAHRLQLTEEMLEEAGIDSNKVRVEVVDGKVIISKE